MSVKVIRDDGSEALNDRESVMRLFEEGFVSSDGTTNDTDNKTWYQYDITIPSSILGQPFLVFIKSDMDEMISSPSGAGADYFRFFSEININKEYKIFSPIFFGSYATGSSHGAQFFDENGILVYDSRVPEAVYKDSVVFSEQFQTRTHVASSPAWYSMNTVKFPAGIFVIEATGARVAVLVSIKQIDSTTTSSGQVTIPFPPGSEQNSGANVDLPLMLLETKYI